MKIDEFLALMQKDLLNEYKHMHFYMHASFILKGPERLFAVPWLANQASEEMGHVRQFAEKISAFGRIPVPPTAFEQPAYAKSFSDVLMYALKLEEEVIVNYQDRLRQSEQIFEDSGKNYDLVLFYEEQLEHSQADADEIVKLLGSARS